MRKVSVHEEDKHQIELIKYMQLKYPSVLIYANWNQGISGQKGAIYGKLRQLKGVVAGIPDLFVAHPGKDNKRGLYIEMKSEKGVLSKAQKTNIAYLARFYDVSICYGLDQAIEAITKYLG